MINNNMIEETVKKDINIWKKYIIKDNMSFGSDYFTIILWWWAATWALFFINPTIPMIVIGIVIISLFVYLYKQKWKNIITSVTVYKYNVIFMEILFKNFKIEKDTFLQLKKLFKHKK